MVQHADAAKGLTNLLHVCQLGRTWTRGRILSLLVSTFRDSRPLAASQVYKGGLDFETSIALL